ncbi:Sugar phosphate phosphatase [Aphelenchoides bicaudatus]|nr:Sugar phosphate phosphatase [Aphelenchoides bicaudatus]
MSTVPRACSGAVRPSFAYSSITDRWPKIITKIIDQMHQHHKESVNKFGTEGDADVKHIIHNLSRMRYLITTDKPIEPFESDLPNTDKWNSDLKKFQDQLGEKNTTWYKVPWLFTECWMYRWIWQFYQETKHFKEYDPFQIEKEKGYFDSKAHLIALATELSELVKKQLDKDTLKTAISRHIQVCLWGNKADLSLSGGDPHFMSDTLFKELHDLRKNILVDHIDLVRDYLIGLDGQQTVAIVLDNSGLEVFTDFCLAHLLVSQGLVSKVVFHGKAFPWYVSDVTFQDFQWILNTTASSDDKYVAELGKAWKSYVDSGKFVWKSDDFYTFGLPYAEMPQRSPKLYKELRECALTIFKGDLNGRKLIGDLDWPETTPFKTSLRGFDINLVLFRTLKAETLSGLSEETYKKMVEKFEENKEWQVSSDYAIVQSHFISNN